MNRIIDILLTDLRYLIGDLGKDGGLIGPSVYDTAQVLRMAPPAEDMWPALDWLLGQQQPDGGWGDPVVPLSRDVPTLAAMLALHIYSKRKTTLDAIHAGLLFLRRQASQWAEPLTTDIPVGVELLLPRLLEDARAAGLDVPRSPYAALVTLGQRRRGLIAQMRAGAGSPPVHSWEAWGTDPDPALIDGSGGVGHSPAATAAWLRASAGREDLADARAATSRYLAAAAAATGVGIPGVVPTVWPIPRFEQSFSLYALLLANLLTDPRLEDVVRPRVLDLAGAIRHDGASMSDWFATDCDSTAVTFAVVLGGGCRPNRDALQRFAGRDGAFMTYPGELQHSISAMGHAAHTLSLLDEDPLPTLDYLAKYRTSDGRWIADKWHASWIYLTSHILAAQICAGRAARSQASLQTLIDHQRPDGSWGATTAVYEETAHSVLALLAFDAVGALPEHGRQSLQQAAGWLIQMYRPLVEEMTICWIGKELYSPHRVARAFVTSATLACILRGYGL